MTFSMQDDSIERAATTPLTNWRRNLFGIVISCVCIGFIVWRINLVEVQNAISHFHWPYLLLGLISLAFGYTIRIVRWSTLLRAAGAKVSPTACAAPFLGSIALNNVLPMRLGDVVRALVFPSSLGIGKITATGSLIMERLVDLMTLLACLAIGLVASSKTRLPEWIASIAVSLAALGGIALVLVFLFSGRLSQWCDTLIDRHWSDGKSNRTGPLITVRDLLASFNAMSRIPVLIALFFLSMLVWVGEAGLFWSLLHGFGFEASATTAVVVMAIATLSTLVPSSPGYVGPFHLAAYAAIAMLGGTQGQATSFAVLAHLGVWLPTTLVGAMAIFMSPHLFNRGRARTSVNQ